MKTITEFSGFTLKDALSKKSALLAEGKTEEEAQAAINEQLKLLDDTKVTFFKNAIDMSKSRLDQVKRVVVAVKSSETEKVPEAFSEREGNFYLVEFFSQASSAARGNYSDERDFRGGRGGDRGRGGRDGRGGPGRSGDRGRGEGRSEGRGEGRPDRGPRPDQSPRGEFAKPREGVAPPPVGERKPRAPKAPRPAGERKPRPPQAPRGNQGPKGAAELRLVLKGQSASTLQGSGIAGSSADASSSEAPQA